MNFGGIDHPEYSSLDNARAVIFPVSYGGSGSMAIIEASQQLELYDEETGAEVYKAGIHTLNEFLPLSTPDATTTALGEAVRDLIKTGKFICMLGGGHMISVPAIRAHAERYYDLSVLQIDARPDLQDVSGELRYSNSSVMTHVVRDMRLPSVQVGIRSISADEARLIESGLPTTIFRARDIIGRTNWINAAIDSLTDNVYLTIDIHGLDPSIVPGSVARPEPGGLGWYETLALIRRTAEKKRIVGMDLVEYAGTGADDPSAGVCAKLVYKTLGYVVHKEDPHISG